MRPGCATAIATLALALLAASACEGATVVRDGGAALADRALVAPSHTAASARTALSYPVTPLVTRPLAAYVAARSDYARSTSLGWIVVPLVLVVLIEAELLAVAGRRNARTLRAVGWPLALLFALLVFIRLKAYAG